MKSPYTYTLLRYVHDIATGEFVNVGVVLCSPSSSFMAAKTRTTYGRVSSVFPGVDGEILKKQLRALRNAVNQRGEEMRELKFKPDPTSALEFAHRLIPADDSAFQWSPEGAGLTSSPQTTLDRLYNRLVAKYDEHPNAHRRTDEDVWKHYRKDLESKHVLKFLESKTINTEDDEVVFDYAWKNGVWHCFEPVSFDLSSADGIKEKAHKLLGRMVSVKDAAKSIKLYVLAGAPSDPRLKQAYEKAVTILKKLPGKSEIVPETEAERFSSRIAGMIEADRGHRRL